MNFEVIRKKICSHANVALNLQPKTVEINESASESAAAAETRSEHKIRKTDGDEKMELTAQSSNACQDESEQTFSQVATSNDIVRENTGESKQQEKMEIGSSEPSTSTTEEDNDIGEIHIVSVGPELSLKFCVC